MSKNNLERLGDISLTDYIKELKTRIQELGAETM